MRLIVAALFVAAASAQDPKTFFEQLPSTKPNPTFDQLMRAVDQIAGLTKAQAQDLLPPVFAALKNDGDLGLHGALALHTIARRPDSNEILKPYMEDIAALFGRSDARFKATADFVLMEIKPTHPEATGILLSFINGPSGTVQEKIDALSALARINKPPSAELEAATLQIFKMPLPPGTMGALINAATYSGASTR